MSLVWAEKATPPPLLDLSTLHTLLFLLADSTVFNKVGSFNLSCWHVSTVDSEIPSLGAKWVSGHHEDLGMTDVFSAIYLNWFLMEKPTKLGRSQVWVQFCYLSIFKILVCTGGL